MLFDTPCEIAALNFDANITWFHMVAILVSNATSAFTRTIFAAQNCVDGLSSHKRFAAIRRLTFLYKVIWLVQNRRNGKLKASFFLHALVKITLQVFWDLDSEHKSFISVRNQSLEVWISHNVRALLAIYASFESIKSHCHEFSIQQSVEKVLEVLSDAGFGHWDLPKI